MSRPGPGTGHDVVHRTLAAPARLGPARLLCIDGPAGSGKTTLAAAVLSAVPPGTSVAVVHLDDVYPGWRGLAEGVRRADRDLLAPLARGEPGRYRRYDWVVGAEDGWCEVDPVDLLVLEGVGAGSVQTAHISLLVWVEAPPEVRTERGIARDVALLGLHDDPQLRSRWRQWTDDEAALYARDRTRDRADVVVEVE